MLNIKKNLKKICVGLAFISVISIAPTIVQASQLTLLHGWIYQKNNWYHYDFGHKETGWLKDSGDWYFLNSQGIMETEWQGINGKWYYFYPGGSMATNTTIDGYTVGPNGAWEE